MSLYDGIGGIDTTVSPFRIVNSVQDEESQDKSVNGPSGSEIGTYCIHCTISFKCLSFGETTTYLCKNACQYCNNCDFLVDNNYKNSNAM